MREIKWRTANKLRKAMREALHNDDLLLVSVPSSVVESIRSVRDTDGIEYLLGYLAFCLIPIVVERSNPSSGPVEVEQPPDNRKLRL